MRILFICFMLLFSACEGSKSIQGEKGDIGEKGAPGEKGEPGEKGDPGDSGDTTTEEYSQTYDVMSQGVKIGSFFIDGEIIRLSSGPLSGAEISYVQIAYAESEFFILEAYPELFVRNGTTFYLETPEINFDSCDPELIKVGFFRDEFIQAHALKDQIFKMGTRWFKIEKGIKSLQETIQEDYLATYISDLGKDTQSCDLGAGTIYPAGMKAVLVHTTEIIDGPTLEMLNDITISIPDGILPP